MTSALFPAFIKGFALSAGLIVAIGAQNMFVLRQGLKREHVLPIVLFCALADASLIVAGVSGLGQVLALVPALSLILSLGGAAFLAWSGVSALRRAASPAALVVADQAGLTLGAALAGTAAFTFLNPHVYIDTVMLMGAVGASLPTGERPLFMAGAALASLAWFSGLGFGARFLTPLFARPAAWRVLDLGIGMVMLALAASLLVGAAAA
ncbi:amino acid transporter [Caulobacter sp. D4A]|uniref:LysE/ArgO family amino acid transporter n=1 Tax=unclassified Caulobacter TaxID=2648921 RepID=UPI000D7299A6|nr:MULTISPECIES: LysE/ArgO family amino acid transporter [unclassified Caulobacter]PXA86633.1 amino acid transporter [Caulobacter sp. D4A]PXA88507.1 amino acid transporter [Caulobacter sp. D5]